MPCGGGLPGKGWFRFDTLEEPSPERRPFLFPAGAPLLEPEPALD